MKKNINFILCLSVLMFVLSCKTPYTPTPVAANSNYLVVEGLINITDSTYVKLSRTVNVANISTAKPELKAAITIVSNTGNSYRLTEFGNGLYTAPPLKLNAANQYRLQIKTASGSIYNSDFVQAKVAPPIDSVVTEIKDDGIHIGVSTHDAANDTRYYRWDYAETWQFHTFYESFLYFNGLSLVTRTNQNQIYNCWASFTSATVLLASTATLGQDVLLNNPITFVESSSEKLQLRYSIIVKEYVLTKDGYDYWTLLKKNTEQLGSIFDVQPSTSIGNLHCLTNAQEPVIGFISAGTFTQKRIFIDHVGLPLKYFQDYVDIDPYNANSCPLLSIDPLDYPILYNPKNPVYIPTALGGTTRECADCTLRGTTTTPSFWVF